MAARRQWATTSRGDVIHYQFPPHFPLGLVLFALAAIRGCKIVFTVHDPLPHRWLYPRRLRFLEMAMRRCAYKMSDVLIVHNEAGRDILIRQFNQPPEKIEIIPHGPMNIGNRLGSPPPASGELRLLLFGSIRENKGIRLAIEGVKKVNASGQLRAKLTIAGQAENSADGSYWQNCLDSIALSPEMFDVMYRYIDEKEVPDLVERHHAVILPYTAFVSESGVAALALTHARPLIGTRAGGLGELLGKSGAGIFIPASTTDGVAEAIETALKMGKNELAVMGERGAVFMQRERGWAAIARRTAAIYSRLSMNDRHAQTAVPEQPCAREEIEAATGSGVRPPASAD